MRRQFVLMGAVQAVTAVAMVVAILVMGADPVRVFVLCFTSALAIFNFRMAAR